MKRVIDKGATSQSLQIFIRDTSVTDKIAGKTGLLFNTASLEAHYVRNGGLAQDITLATLAAADSAWSSGGFKEISAAKWPGLYRLDVPDAVFATGVDSAGIVLFGAAGMEQVNIEIELATPVQINASGAIHADLKFVDSTAALLTRLAKALGSNGRGTVAAGSTTTSIVTSACDPVGVVGKPNQFKSRVVLFDADTTTTSLRSAVGVISASTGAVLPTFTLNSALPDTPVAGDTFTII